MAAHDLVTLGEVLLRLSLPSPERFDTVRRLDVQFGGAEANVASACARLGLRVAWLSALPDNPWGHRVRRELAGHGVDCAGVRMVEGARLGAYFLEYGVPPRPIRVLYDRRDSAFARMQEGQVDWAVVGAARLVHLTGITPALGPGPRALVERAAAEAAALSFDVNYRSTLWSPAEAAAFARGLLPRVRWLFLGREEARTLWGLEGDPERVVREVGAMAPRATVSLLMGEEGALVLDGGRLFRPGLRPAVQVVDPIGAGDAFVAGFLWKVLGGGMVQQALDAGTAVAALKCSIWGDIALVTPREAEEVLAGGRPGVRR